MLLKRTGFHEKISYVVIISALLLLLTVIPVFADTDDEDDIPIGAYANPYNPYGWGNPSPYLAEVSSTLTIEPLASSGSSSSAT